MNNIVKLCHELAGRRHRFRGITFVKVLQGRLPTVVIGDKTYYPPEVAHVLRFDKEPKIVDLLEILGSTESKFYSHLSGVGTVTYRDPFWSYEFNEEKQIYLYWTLLSYIVKRKDGSVAYMVSADKFQDLKPEVSDE